VKMPPIICGKGGKEHLCLKLNNKKENFPIKHVPSPLQDRGYQRSLTVYGEKKPTPTKGTPEGG